MNEYMINPGFSRVSVPAANEKDARRIYRENTTAEEKHFKDIAVELIRENVPATKQQEREAAAAKEELEAVRKHLQTAEDDANFYRDKVLDSDDLTDIAQLIDGHISQLRDMVKASEVAILENAEHPEAKIFTDAVRDRKNLTKDIEYYQALAQRVKHARGQ